MAEETVEGVVILCPMCGSWVMRGAYEGTAQVNCRGNRRDSGKCGAILEVQFKSGTPTVSVIGNTRKA
ncbi:MAG: hypothetical protein ACREDF_09550 [Thermoplasmata archaeon]